jgi:predicted LPLAT superfamily acyltransferase
MVMGVKQYGSALGHKIIIGLYKVLGYRVVSFILNFVAFYYALFTPSVRKSLESYYEHLGIELTFWRYYKHINSFSHSIFDRFISRISPEEISFVRENREAFVSMQEGGIALLSHVGGWATAAHTLNADIPPMHMVMREAQKDKIKRLEREKKRSNESGVKIIDLNDGAIAANIQIANVLMKKEIIAMMTDRVVDTSKTVGVEFLGSKVFINKNPFDIAFRFKKKLVATFAVSEKKKEYKMIFREIELQNKSLEEIAQEYMNILEDIIKIYPNQWYNFYDFFNQSTQRKIDVNK